MAGTQKALRLLLLGCLVSIVYKRHVPTGYRINLLGQNVKATNGTDIISSFRTCNLLLCSCPYLCIYLSYLLTKLLAF